MDSERLDSTDLNILRAMQENARLTTKELAQRVNLSSTPVFERLKRLEREGYIKRYVALLDSEKLNCGFQVFCMIKIQRLTTHSAEEFRAHVRSLPQVTECYNISGGYDYMLKIRVKDMKQYRHFVLDSLGKMEAVASVESIFVMEEVKMDHCLRF